MTRRAFERRPHGAPVLAAVVLGALAGCDAPSWGLEQIDLMVTPADPPLVCPVPLPPDGLSADRDVCRFGKGASAEDTLGVAPDVAASIPIRHVVVIMKENRSFDHLLGGLAGAGQPAAEPVPASFENLDRRDRAVRFHPATSTCIDDNAPHQWDAMHAAVNGGRMDGFVRQAAVESSGHYAMDTYGPRELPFYYWLAGTFALNDRHFAAALSGTDPNRDFLVLGTNAGIRETGSDTPDPTTPTLFRALMNAGYTWGAFSDDYPLGDSLGWDTDSPGVHSFADFLWRLDTGTLPNVSFVDGVDSEDDDNPPADLQRGEAWLRAIYEHAIRSPQWPRTAIIWTYDEAGGFADHLAPPHACVPDASEAEAPYFELGPRVPLVVISPYAKPGFVSHVVQDHTAITRFIETVFGLGALSARDANSAALLDMFDFSCEPPLLDPAPAPAAGSDGCAE